MDDKAERDSLISQFVSITGAHPDQGRQLLESADWNIDLATSNFFELQDQDQAEEASLRSRNQLLQQSSSETELSQAFYSRDVEVESEEEEEEQSEQNRAIVSSDSGDQDKMKKSKAAKSSRNRITTLGSLKNEEESSDDEGQQAFYAGGSEHSGQNVLGPPTSRKPKDPNELIQNMFKSAKEHGAQVVDPSEQSTSRRSQPVFKGTGYKLGSDPAEPSAPSTFPAPDFPESVHMHLKMWRNGFSVDDGPLRRYDDPESREFLASIEKGEVPRELIRLAKGGEVNLNMEDHRQEEYVPPKRKLQAFAGSGQRLGGVAPAVDSDAAAGPSVPASGGINKVEIPIDESKPVTNVQVRLADGTRLVVKLNLTHTISDIRTYICNAREAYAAQPFALMTTFPNAELSDESLTIEEAKLQNSVVVQRLK